MKTLLAVMILGGILTTGPAAAGSYGGGFYAQDKSGFAYSKGQGRRYERVERPQRYVPPAPPNNGASGRLTDDERRQLHRDLDKANRELYRGRRR